MLVRAGASCIVCSVREENYSTVPFVPPWLALLTKSILLHL